MQSDKQIEHAIRRRVGRAIGDFSLIADNDRILVALSGGKDSWTLLHMLLKLQQRAPIRFSLVAVTVHPGFPGFDPRPLEAYLAERGIEYHVVSAPVHTVMLETLGPDETPCSLCARIKRGVLYSRAREMGCTSIALGHHADDFIETLLLNLFFNGRIKAMSARYLADDGKTSVIRPLVYVSEESIIHYARTSDFPVVCCACPACGDEDLQRNRIKRLLADLEQEHPGIKANVLAALGRVDPRHLLLNRSDISESV
jgi:tRNA 2-thiocytidine biosynthesis protein TtcA